jgi:uncharacterized protein
MLSRSQPGSHRLRQRGRFNAVVMLVLGLPAFAIAASVGTAILAVTRGDPPLPDQYHWEGDKLDHDFAGAHKAEQLRVRVSLKLAPEAGRCHAVVQIASVPPESLRVTLIHGSQPQQDRVIEFTREPSSTHYKANCSALVAGSWHVEVAEPVAGWTLRQDASLGASGAATLSTAVATDVGHGSR